MILRFVNYLMIALFLLAAIVQYNDTNALGWVGIYGVAAIACILFSIRKLNFILASIVVGVSGIWAMLKIPDLTIHGFRHMFDEVQMNMMGVEAAREFLGLLIIFGWLMVLAVSSYRTKKDDVSLPGG